MNPEIQERLGRLADKLDKIASRSDPQRVSGRVDQHLQGGLVPRAIMRVLAESVEPLRVQTIHEGVELVIGRSVSHSTIKNALARQVRSGDGRLVRLERGRYRLLGE